LQDRCALDLPLGDQFREDRRLQDAEPYIEADDDEQQAEEKRYTPSPGQKRIAGHPAECQYREIGEEEAGGRAELRPRGDKAAVPM
jgi:hypothetical protein